MQLPVDKSIRIGASEFSKETLLERMNLAASWISDIAQVRDENDKAVRHHKHSKWVGAVKGEYSAAKKEWSFFCPVWHTGQAVKSLAEAYQATGENRFLAAARSGAEFITKNQINDKSNADYGLIMAYEDKPDQVNISAVLECLDGLSVMDGILKTNRYSQNILAAADWVVSKAWLKGKGLIMDLYDPAENTFIEKAYGGHEGRPLLEDGILLKAFRMSGKRIFRNAFFEIADRLLEDEFPAGNWVNYTPCDRSAGRIHPRHAYWWGNPMFMAYKESGDRRYLDCALRSCRWYAKAQRADGGLLRGTYTDFTTDSFGHATSGIAAAMTMFCNAIKITGSEEFLPPLAKALDYCMKMQFINPSDTEMKGAILEKILPPDGTDNSPYYIRDLGTIFFIQGVFEILTLTPLKLNVDAK